LKEISENHDKIRCKNELRQAESKRETQDSGAAKRPDSIEPQGNPAPRGRNNVKKHDFFSKKVLTLKELEQL